MHIQGQEMFAFWKIWRALLSCYLCFEIRPLALLLTKIYILILNQGLTLTVIYELFLICRVESCRPSLHETLSVKVACYVSTCSECGVFHGNAFRVTNYQSSKQTKYP